MKMEPGYAVMERGGRANNVGITRRELREEESKGARKGGKDGKKKGRRRRRRGKPRRERTKEEVPVTNCGLIVR